MDGSLCVCRFSLVSNNVSWHFKGFKNEDMKPKAIEMVTKKAYRI